MTKTVQLASALKEVTVFLNVCVVQAVLYERKVAVVKDKTAEQKNVLVITSRDSAILPYV